MLENPDRLSRYAIVGVCPKGSMAQPDLGLTPEKQK